MIGLETRLSDAARAGFAAVVVPPMPAFATPASRRLDRRMVAAALVAAVILGVAAAGNREALGDAVHEIVYFLDGRPRANDEVPTVDLATALRTTAFHVVAPAGLPADARLIRIDLVGTAVRPVLVFRFERAGRPFEVTEWRRGGPAPPPGSGRAPDLMISSSQITGWRAGNAMVTLSSGEGTLTEAETGAIRRAMSL